MNAIILRSDRLILRPLSLQHLTLRYVSWMNDIDVYRFLESGGNYTLEMLEQYLNDVVKKDIYFWAIHRIDGDKHIGNIKIDPVNFKHGVAEYGIMMGEKDEWGKGYGKEATELVLDFCFNTLNLRKITLGFVANNIGAFTLYNKLGFIQEGLLKNHGIYQGEYCDIIRMAKFNPSINHDK